MLSRPCTRRGSLRHWTAAAPEDEVYAAFGIAVNEGLDDFSAQLSANRKDNTPETRCEVFDRLNKIYKEYEQDIDNKKKEKQ